MMETSDLLAMKFINMMLSGSDTLSIYNERMLASDWTVIHTLTSILGMLH